MNFIEKNPDKGGGEPVLKGTRFPVSQLIAEIADRPNETLAQICKDFRLDFDTAAGALQEVSVVFGDWLPTIPVE